jgi:hypothetical protein
VVLEVQLSRAETDQMDFLTGNRFYQPEVQEAEVQVLWALMEEQEEQVHMVVAAAEVERVDQQQDLEVRVETV